MGPLASQRVDIMLVRDRTGSENARCSCGAQQERFSLSYPHRGSGILPLPPIPHDEAQLHEETMPSMREDATAEATLTS